MNDDSHGDLDAILDDPGALLGEATLTAGQLIAAWGERAGRLAERAQRWGDCRAGEVAAAEAGAWRNAAAELSQIVRLP